MEAQAKSADTGKSALKDSNRHVRANIADTNQTAPIYVDRPAKGNEIEYGSSWF